MLNAWLTDADASIKGAVRDGGIGCAIALLTVGIGNILKRVRNAVGNNGPTTNPDGPGTKNGDGDDGGGSGNRDGEDGSGNRDGEGCIGSQCVLCNSFPSGTQVRMGNGTLKPIEDIEPGDYVLAHDLDTNQWRPQLVLDQWSHLDDGHMATVTISDGTSVTATDHHQFWNETDQAWLELDQIEPGDMLLTPTGPIEVTALSVAYVANTLVWELTVDTDHNFTVHTGSADVLVHNNDCPPRLHWPSLTPEESEALRNTMEQIRSGNDAGLNRHGFSNRDGQLPEGPSYQAYDVASDAADGGRRRVVVGSDGSMYYTQTHCGDAGTSHDFFTISAPRS